MEKLDPLEDRILVKPDPRPDKVGNIYIPEQIQERPMVGTVIAVGPGKKNKKGEYEEKTGLKGGERVTYAPMAGEELEIRDEEHILIRAENIIGIVR